MNQGFAYIAQNIKQLFVNIVCGDVFNMKSLLILKFNLKITISIPKTIIFLISFMRKAIFKQIFTERIDNSFVTIFN